MLQRRMLALVLCVAIVPASFSQHVQTDPFSPLSAEKESALRSSAIGGSGADAYNLAMYYGFTKADLEEELRWAIIGAENGDAKSQWLTFCLLEKRIPADDRARARFWLKRAADQGYQPAQKVLTDEQAGGDPKAVPARKN